MVGGLLLEQTHLGEDLGALGLQGLGGGGHLPMVPRRQRPKRAKWKWLHVPLDVGRRSPTCGVTAATVRPLRDLRPDMATHGLDLVTFSGETQTGALVSQG
ncbi:hypothetical protein GCM10027273_41630 [Nocardioides pakistanensis]